MSCYQKGVYDDNKHRSRKQFVCQCQEMKKENQCNCRRCRNQRETRTFKCVCEETD